ncbi:hypothetical protein E5K31_RS12235, partial [Enterococcus hirae]
VIFTKPFIILGSDIIEFLSSFFLFEKIYEVASQQPQLNDNQKIVLEWLKSNRNSLKVPMLAIYELAELADENTNLAYHQLDSKQEIEVLAAFAQWGLGQEEER